MIEILIWIAIMILTVALVTFVLSRLPKSVFFLAIILCISGVSFPLFQSQFSHTDGAFAYLKFLSTGLACLIVGWYRFAGSQPNCRLPLRVGGVRSLDAAAAVVQS